ncbi:MAG: BNR-4 repeat-containing protein [Thermoguttaceae bacterium]|jgi:hypothetical protein|nr:BNR-4 repeat-containing protein [Thermoguttaceae bacterium]
MCRFFTCLVFSAAVMLLGSACDAADESAKPAADTASADAAKPIHWAIGGCGGAFFLASPGELVIDIHKRDRGRRRTELRAILVGPDRRVLQDVTISSDDDAPRAGFGSARWARLRATVERKGVYALNVTASQDRYGDHIAWGFQTNCEHYLVETARGHRDRRREEPIVLLHPERPGDVCFHPRPGEFSVEISGLPKTVTSLTVVDGEDQSIAELRPDAEGGIVHTFPAQQRRDAVPWRIHFPVQQAVINIDGVTRWDAGDPYPNLACWTPDAQSWFALLPNRWLLTPYQRTIYAEAGSRGQTTFQVHNNSSRKRTINLAIESRGEPWPAKLSSTTVELAGKSAVNVQLEYESPPAGARRVCHLRATPADDPEVSTYATLTCAAGEAPATKPLDMPLVLKPYEHENEQFGYLPDYPVDNEVYFDLGNRPFIQTRGGIATMRDNRWSIADQSAVTRRPPELEGAGFGAATSKVAFDLDGQVYLLTRSGSRTVLLHSVDSGKSFAAYPLPQREDGPQSFDIEQFSGHNNPDGPPPILRYTRTAVDPNVFWRRVHDLELILAERKGDQIVFDSPILLTDNCIGLASHSGIPASVVSRGNRVHVVWAEATDPAEQVPGVPTYVATFDREARRLSIPALVAYGPPANDIHNSPSITMDSEGYLHVLAGTHGRPFPYAKSLVPNDAGSGWTEAELVGGDLRQTYIGMVCDPDDTLHLVYRLWQSGVEPHPASHHAVLAYQRKPADGPWEAPRALVVPPFSEYSVFYHRLTIDRLGRLFLSYDYRSTYWFYQLDHFGSRRALMMSPDGGNTWQMATTKELTPASP